MYICIYIYTDIHIHIYGYTYACIYDMKDHLGFYRENLAKMVGNGTGVRRYEQQNEKLKHPGIRAPEVRMNGLRILTVCVCVCVCVCVWTHCTRTRTYVSVCLYLHMCLYVCI